MVNASCHHLSASLQGATQQQAMMLSAEEIRASLSVVNMSMPSVRHSDAADAAGMFSVYFVRVPLYMIIMLVSLIGNGLVIVVICSNRFMLTKPTNYFMLNLAVCDLLILVSCVWVEMVTSVNRLWILSELFCKLNSYLQIASIVASVWTLVAITCDRFMAVMHPLKWHTTRTRTIVCVVSIWMLSLTISSPSYLYRTLIQIHWSDYVEAYCDDLDWPVEIVEDEHGCSRATQPGKRIYYTSLIVMMFFVPMLVMVVAYSIVIAKLWLAKTIGITHNSQPQANNKKVIVMLVWILVVFFVCWSPLEGMLLFVEYSAETPAWWPHVEWIAYMMAYTSTAINPFIYAGMSENYKLGFRRMCTRLTGKSRVIRTSFDLDRRSSSHEISRRHTISRHMSLMSTTTTTKRPTLQVITALLSMRQHNGLSNGAARTGRSLSVAFAFDHGNISSRGKNQL